MASAAQGAATAGQAYDLVAAGATAARLAGQLEHERAAAALVFIEPGAQATADYRSQGTVTDTLVQRLESGLDRARVPGTLQPLVIRIHDDLADLSGLRQQVTAGPTAVLSVVVFQYGAMVADLIGYRQALGQVGVAAGTANGLRSVAALSQAIESLAQLQVEALRVVAGGALTPAEQQQTVAADTGATEALQTFTDLGQAGWGALLDAGIGGGPKVVLAERLQGLVTRAQPGQVLSLGTDPRGWSQAMGSRIDAMHAVESTLDNQLLRSVGGERDQQRRNIAAEVATVALLLLVVVVVGLWVARSLTGSLSRLRAGALEVAQHRLPGMVRQLDVENADPAVIERLLQNAARPIRADGRDEVGEVAGAFNTVVASAVRLAGEQAALRTAVGAILVSLSRRLQLRADAMMRSMDELQRDEQDPARLGKLFDLDHVATLIRRLIFNLRILAGGRGGGAVRGEPVPLEDLLRAAGQEIDDYTRVHPGDVDQTVEIAGDISDELIHLLAELLDNAARYSPPDAPVLVDARGVGDQVHIQIRDSGVGMAEAELRVARDRLANPRRLDNDTTRRMGLPVVGAIAHRLGIRIELRSQPGQGTAVDVTVPGGLFRRSRAQTQPDSTPLGRLATISQALHLTAPPPPARALPPRAPAFARALPKPAMEKPLIYEQLRRDPTRSWFHSTPVPEEIERQPVGTVNGWRMAAEAAQAATTAVPDETTPGGLPVRQPGRRLIPQAESGAALPVQRHPDKMRRQMSAMQHGLGQAGRRANNVTKGRTS
ncbi:MAG: sensor histidine kinase [Micromonosporaceae bacterium]|nr:sensor histidine kinase [Micromonosporaceae bacterium]